MEQPKNGAWSVKSQESGHRDERGKLSERAGREARKGEKGREKRERRRNGCRLHGKA